jgi:hypothetical protein
MVIFLVAYAVRFFDKVNFLWVGYCRRGKLGGKIEIYAVVGGVIKSLIDGNP